MVIRRRDESLALTSQATTRKMQFIERSRRFDKRLPKYQHIMGDIYVGEHVTYFEGVLKVWMADGSVIETPFWDKIEVDPSSGKITTMYALFSIAAVPEELEGFEARGFCSRRESKQAFRSQPWRAFPRTTAVSRAFTSDSIACRSNVKWNQGVIAAL